jgi:hypothetical protein
LAAGACYISVAKFDGSHHDISRRSLRPLLD